MGPLVGGVGGMEHRVPARCRCPCTQISLRLLAPLCVSRCMPLDTPTHPPAPTHLRLRLLVPNLSQGAHVVPRRVAAVSLPGVNRHHNALVCQQGGLEGVGGGKGGWGWGGGAHLAHKPQARIAHAPTCRVCMRMKGKRRSTGQNSTLLLPPPPPPLPVRGCSEPAYPLLRQLRRMMPTTLPVGRLLLPPPPPVAGAPPVRQAGQGRWTGGQVGEGGQGRRGSGTAPRSTPTPPTPAPSHPRPPPPSHPNLPQPALHQ